VNVQISQDSIQFGERFSVSFQRTLRIPDDGRTYPLPPGLGKFPIYHVGDFADRLPAVWQGRGGVFIPMYQREALWLGFGGADWKPNAVKVGIGHINALSGEAWDEQLRSDPQDYLVVPDQPWLDGINAGHGYVRQFVAMPLGRGYTVEAQVTGTEEFGGIQLLVYEPKPGRFPDTPPPPTLAPEPVPMSAPLLPGMEMGLAAGGKITQKIYPDPYGVETWDEHNCGRLFIHLINSEQYAAITGESPPPTPISAQTYTEYGLPWFDLYDEAQGDVPAAEKLARLKSIREVDAASGLPSAEESIEVPDQQVKKLHHRPTAEPPDP
jgi:hypothetical protein